MEKEFNYYAFKLSLICVIVFILQTIFSGFTDLFVLNNFAWIEVWRFVSSIFLHGGIGHLAYNLFALILFGSILEKIIGGRKFLFVFFVTGILANLISVNFYDSSLGASGAIFGIIGALIFIRPMMTVWAFGMPMPIFVAGILWVVGDLIGAVGFFSGVPLDNTGNIAHLVGVFFGLIIGFFMREKSQSLRKNNLQIDEIQIRNWERHFIEK
jgi:membrane associated rhomboid family serine protease